MNPRRPDAEHSFRDAVIALAVIAVAFAPLCIAVNTRNPHWLWAWLPMGLLLLAGLAG